ncbi:cytochrome c/FTR1 family iron permease [Massilia violaceinigra]|uniref:Cytochrome c/FTR1 family iron permease n=2 Tax=Massilia violaceinigra TaxID=2045208 RepID=A0ABY4A3E9_9BURK|nr:cytochrome c/FTR1 family iron permease [Massilia violaceinigra]UOD29282.1 cytochrome c/FTR1 family iron permease [Massilia violaceinigra]
MKFLHFAALAIAFCLSSMPIHSDAADLADQAKAKQIWQLLDYLAVDYGKAVKGGVVVSQDEYAEMGEFAAAAERQLAELPTTAALAGLQKEATGLRQSIATKAEPALVGEQARRMANALLAAYPVPMAPAKSPDLLRGAQLYQNQCASCHGATGRADGVLASKLSPPPIAFSDRERAQHRSVFALQQIVANGVDGTAMPAFATLTDDDRWALAFFASTLSYSDAERKSGAALWASDPAVRRAVPNLSALSQTSEAALSAHLSKENASQVLAFLRSFPEKLDAASADTLALAKERLTDSLAALQRGDAAQATRLALSSYLDGFEPVEPALAAKNKALFEAIEKSMGAYRGAISAGNKDLAEQIAPRLQGMLSDAQVALGGSADPWATFLGALTILLREGLEALLVVVAMMSFLKKAERTDVLPYVHAGWVAALASGGLTWAAATYLVDLSGASREMTEGFSAVFAAVVLLCVGIWMHQKSLAGRWQSYVKQKLASALNRKSAMVLFLLSFVTVYREVFETVLFYAALWTPGNGMYLLAGLACGVVVLGAIAVVLLRSAARLPISQFFAFSSAMVAVLAVVLMGKGVAAFQKVGVLDITPLALPRIDLLGIYPSMQTILAQLVIIVIIIASVAYNVRSQRAAAAI